MKVKVIIALIALVCCTNRIFADGLIVDKLIHKTTDLSAYSAPKDMNGNPCGLLKVITKNTSMTFEGSIVGTPEYKNGEYWVYIPQGVYQIKLKSASNDPLLLNFKDYNIEKVTSKSTYELTFNGRRYYDWIGKPENIVIQGPSLKKYALVVITLPGTGWTVGGMSTLDYLKRMASVISKYGDGAGNKHECTIVGEKEDLNDSDYLTYKLVMESTDEEDDAILLAAIAYGGCFTPTIYQAYR